MIILPHHAVLIEGAGAVAERELRNTRRSPVQLSPLDPELLAIIGADHHHAVTHHQWGWGRQPRPWALSRTAVCDL